MDKLLQMYGACESSTAYIRLPQDEETFIALARSAPGSSAGGVLEAGSVSERPQRRRRTGGLCQRLGLGAGHGTGMPGPCGSCPCWWTTTAPPNGAGIGRWFVQHYRYTGAYPWYALVGCGHCIDPERDKRKRMQRNPVWRGCTHWRPGG